MIELSVRDGARILVSAALILAVYDHRSGVQVVLANDLVYTVRESFEEIRERIAESRLSE